jgi:hypothetical protein
MLGQRVRLPVVVAVGTALATAALAVLAVTVWPYLKYPGTFERTAARHLDKVDLEGFEYVGEDATDNDAVSRYWILRGRLSDRASAVTYDGQPLRRDRPGQDSLSYSRFEDELGWVHLAGDVPCSLTAWRVKEKPPIGADVDLSNADWSAVGTGTVTLIRVVVLCGGG